jgi:hypothetical protein
MLMSHNQTATQNRNLNVVNRSFKNMFKFRYLGKMVKIKSILNFWNACFHAVHNLSSSQMLSKSLKSKIQKTIILCVVLYGCETWSLTSKEEHRLRMFETRVLRRIFWPKRNEVTGG